MPCFYVRSNSFIAVFRIEEGQVVAELIPSVNLLKEVKDRGIAFTMRSIYEDEKFEP